MGARRDKRQAKKITKEEMIKCANPNCIFKPRSAFNKNRTRKDGLQDYCRECQKKRVREYSTPKKRLEQGRRYNAKLKFGFVPDYLKDTENNHLKLRFFFEEDISNLYPLTDKQKRVYDFYKEYYACFDRHISERQVAKFFKVTRKTVRAALIAIRNKGYINSILFRSNTCDTEKRSLRNLTMRSDELK